jgi:hypothetical protein
VKELATKEWWRVESLQLISLQIISTVDNDKAMIMGEGGQKWERDNALRRATPEGSTGRTDKCYTGE